MSRGRQTMRVRCAGDGCTEFRYYDGMTRGEYVREWKRQSANPWRCLKHGDLDSWMTPSNTSVTETFTLGNEPKRGIRTWIGSRTLGGGFLHGPGFRLDADEFPDGTVVEISVRAVLPEAT